VLSAPLLPTTITGLTFGYVEIMIDVYERYGATPALQANQDSSPIEVFKGKLFINDWTGLNLDDYAVQGGVYTTKFLSDCPSYYLRNGELLEFYFLTTENGQSFSVELNYKDSSGSSLNTESVALSTSDFTNAFSLDWDILDGYYPLEGVATVEVYVDMDAGSGSTETITINIDNSCAEYTARLHFLNQLGGIDAFTFTQVGRYNATTETQSFLTTQGAFDGATFGWDGLNSQVNNYQVGVNRKLKIESGWTTADVQEWLNNNLFTSPYVLLETSNGLLRVANMSTSVTYNRSKTDMLFNTVIEIDELHHTSMIV